ncbi:threonine/serine exporter family protein [Aerococcaceae bacterium DSM 111176]|nr:threonine/serine exporter family protein [Aerococcaceae bacterium DSM 111176]
MENRNQLVISTCLLAGKIMMESGSEGYRIEDTMQRIALNSNIQDASAFVMATGIMMTVNDSSQAQLVQAKNRSNNLNKIIQTNELSRLYAIGKITLDEFHQKLITIDQHSTSHSQYSRVIAAGISSVALMLLFGGVLSDSIFTFLLGSIGYFISEYVFTRYRIKFINDLIASIFLAIFATFIFNAGLISNLDNVIMGCIMPLVPGVALTSAMRDLFEGQLITGLIRMVEAILISFVIGIGIALIMIMF